LLDSEWKQGEGRERRYYQLSTLGVELLEQLTQEWTSLNSAIGPLLLRNTNEEQH
jgi:PadR family transcriptional regulator